MPLPHARSRSTLLPAPPLEASTPPHHTSLSHPSPSTPHHPLLLHLPLRHSSLFTSTQPRVGFIGLGNMGVHMAHNLLKAGHPLTVYDINAKGVDAIMGHAQAVKQTVRVARSPADVALDCRVIITMLPSIPSCAGTCTPTRQTGILSAFPILARSPSSLHLPSSTSHSASTSSPRPSTTTPALHRLVHHLPPHRPLPPLPLLPPHCSMVDAPVSGGIVGAEAASLTFMVGGPTSSFSSAQPFLSRMGRHITHCGDAGTGQTAKVCNNLVLACSMAAVAEAHTLGHLLGMDAKKLAGIFNTSTARCWASEVYNPVPG